MRKLDCGIAYDRLEMVLTDVANRYDIFEAPIGEQAARMVITVLMLCQFEEPEKLTPVPDVFKGIPWPGRKALWAKYEERVWPVVQEACAKLGLEEPPRAS